MIRAGIAVFNERRYHAAHDAWEEPWLDLSKGSEEERFLHGLIQYTAAVHHAHDGNREGAIGLAESALDYLAGVPASYHGVSLNPVREVLRAIAADPGVVWRHDLPPLLSDGAALRLSDLEFEAKVIAARVFAEVESEWDDATIESAIERAETGSPENTFAALLSGFVTDTEQRGLIYRRLEQHLDREARKDADVEGVFDSR